MVLMLRSLMLATRADDGDPVVMVSDVIGAADEHEKRGSVADGDAIPELEVRCATGMEAGFSQARPRHSETGAVIWRSDQIKQSMGK